MSRLGLGLSAATLVLATQTLASPARAERVPWTAPAPDALVATLATGAARGGDDALARLFLITALQEEAARGRVIDALRHVGGPAAVRDDAAWLARTMVPPPLGAHGREAEEGETGLVQNFAVLGPFENAGAEVDSRDAPEAPDHDFAGAD